MTRESVSRREFLAGSAIAGAAIALVSTSLLGVIAGKWLAKNFSPSLLNTLAGLSFLILSLSLLWEAIA